MTKRTKGQSITNTSTRPPAVLLDVGENGTLSIANGGGAGSISGGNFQNRVAAWIAVQILAGQVPDTSWDIAEDSRLEFLRCETDYPIDDLFIGTSTNSRIFIQVKKRLTLTKTKGSDLGSTFDQFVRQFLSHKSSSSRNPSDPIHDRYLLITGPQSSKAILYDLPLFLKTTQSQAVGEALADAPMNDVQREVWDVISHHLKASWQAILGTDPSEIEIKEILSLISIHCLDVYKGGTAEREAKNLLRSAVLLDDERVNSAWSTLFEECATLAEMRAGADRVQLQTRLRRARIGVSFYRDTRAELSIRDKYLNDMLQRYNTIMLPISNNSTMQLYLTPIFQPLRLHRDPLTAEDLLERKRRTLLGEPFDEMPFITEDITQLESVFVTANNAEDALAKSPHKRVVILGGPGTGKTTVLKNLAIEQAKRALNDPDFTELIPIFVSFSDFVRSGKTLQNYLIEIMHNITGSNTCSDLLWQAIRYGQAFICLDSLDEVDPQERTKALKLIDMWAANTDNMWIIGSRFAEYKGGQFNHLRFNEWELLPLDHYKRQELAALLIPRLSQWIYGEETTKLHDPMIFVRELQSHSQAMAWGENPLLFSLAAIVFVQTGTLPPSRTTLYGEVVALILKTHEPDTLWRKILKLEFGALALWFFTKKGRIFSAEDIVTFFLEVQHLSPSESRDMTKRVISSGLLEVVAHETYGFQHQTFQEYLSAVGLAQQFVSYDADIKQSAKNFAFHKHTYSRWTEVLRLLVGVLVQEKGKEGKSEAQRWLFRLLEQRITLEGDPGNLGLMLALRSLSEITEAEYDTELQIFALEENIVLSWIDELLGANLKKYMIRNDRLEALINDIRHLSPYAVKVIKERLFSIWESCKDDGKTRCTVIKVLGALGEHAPVDFLLSVLQDEDRDVRCAAINALAGLNERTPIAPLVVALQDKDSVVRGTAIKVLGKMEEVISLELLLSLRHDESWEVKRALENTLKMRARHLSPELLLSLLSDNDNINSLIIKAFGLLGDRAPLEPLLAALHDKDLFVRSYAVEALGKLGDRAPLEPLLAALQDKDKLVYKSALKTLGLLGKRAPLEPLLIALDNEDLDTRWNAVEALGKLGDRAPLEPLLVALQDEDEILRSEAVKALGALGSRAPLEPLLAALSDESTTVRQEAAKTQIIQASQISHESIVAKAHNHWVVRCIAVEILKVSGVQMHLDLLSSTLQDENYHVRSAAVEALGTLGDLAPLEPLLAALDDPHWMVRNAVLDVLGTLGERTPLELLLNALQDQHWLVRGAAVKALGILGERAPLEPIITALHDERICWSAMWALRAQATRVPLNSLIAALYYEDGRMCWAAVKMLGMLGHHAPLEPLLAALQDQDALVRATALRALGSLGERVPLEPLLLALQDQDKDVQCAAIEALASQGKRTPFELVLEAFYNLYNQSYDPRSVRASAVRALAALGDRVPFQILHVALRDKDVNVRKAAVEVLGVLKTQVSLEPLLSSLNDERGFVQSEAVNILGTKKLVDRVGNLLIALHNIDKDVRKAAIKAIANLGSFEKSDVLIDALGDEDKDVCCAAVQALHKFAPEKLPSMLPDAIAVLQGQLPNTSDSLLLSSAKGLLANVVKDIGHKSPRLVSLVVSLLDWPHWQVQAKAAQALGKLRRNIPDAAIRRLLELRRDTDPLMRVVRDAADDALAEILSLETGIEDD